MKWFRIISVTIPLVGVYGVAFCYFLTPDALVWMFFAGVLFLIPLACLFIEALFYRNKKSIFIFALTWLLLALPFAGVRETNEWLGSLGFYVKTLIVSDYLSRCQLSHFVENGVNQMAGVCEGFDRGDYFESIVYDTTGEFIMPTSKRTPEWKKAMSTATDEATLKRYPTASHLFGNYYAVVIDIIDLKG